MSARPPSPSPTALRTPANFGGGMDNAGTASFIACILVGGSATGHDDTRLRRQWHRNFGTATLTACTFSGARPPSSAVASSTAATLTACPRGQRGHVAVGGIFNHFTATLTSPTAPCRRPEAAASRTSARRRSRPALSATRPRHRQLWHGDAATCLEGQRRPRNSAQRRGATACTSQATRRRRRVPA